MPNAIEIPSQTNVPDVCVATAIMFSTDYAEGNLMGLDWVPQLIIFNQQSFYLQDA